MSNSLLTTLIQSGVKSSGNERVTQLVNTISLVTGLTAITAGPTLGIITHQELIIAPAALEGLLFFTVIYLNIKHLYKTAIALMLITHNLAGLYFGILFGMIPPMQLLTLGLASISLFIFSDLPARLFSTAIAVSIFLFLEINSTHQFIRPLYFDAAHQQLIRQMGTAVLLSLDIIVLYYFVRQMETLIRKEKESNQQMEILIKRVKEDNQFKTFLLRESNHEVKNPIHILKGVIDIHRITGEENRYKDVIIPARNFNGMYSAMMVLVDIVRNVMDFSRMDAGIYSPLLRDNIYVEEWISTITDMYFLLAEKKCIDITLNISKQVPINILADKGKLTQVLVNLITNAVKFTAYHKGINISIGMNGQQLVCSVQDQGEGIPPDRLENLFSSEWVSEKSEILEGSGLGMIVTKKTIEQLRGTIKVTSTLGLGSTFVISVPIEVQKGTPEHEKPIKHIYEGNVKKVLVIEDDKMGQMLMKHMLEDLGFKRIFFADNGKEAMALIEELIPNLILLDLELPGMSGRNILALMKQNPILEKIPVIIVTGNENLETINLLKSEGAEGFLKKPYDPADISRELAVFMEN